MLLLHLLLVVKVYTRLISETLLCEIIYPSTQKRTTRRRAYAERTNMASPNKRQKHVVIVGAGAAGMSCAASLAQHPDKFKVTVIERGSVCGGQATSISLDEKTFGASWMNNGVQGGSPVRRLRPQPPFPLLNNPFRSEVLTAFIDIQTHFQLLPPV